MILFFVYSDLVAQQKSILTEKPANQKSFIVEAGIGAGFANQVNEQFYESTPIFGTTFNTGLGMQFNSKFRAGVDIFLWYESGQMFHNPSQTENPNNYRMSVLAFTSFYPFERYRAYFQIGIGAGNFFFTPDESMILSDGSQSRSSVIDTGFSTGTGIGWDLKISEKSYLVPSFNFYYTFLGNLQVFPGRIENNNPSLVIDFQIDYMFKSGF